MTARTCTDATRAKCAVLEPHKGRADWLRIAISDCVNGRPVSLAREDRMCRALGIPSPKRQPRRFYRPCLSVELGEIMREYGWSPEVILWQWVREYQAQEAPCQS